MRDRFSGSMIWVAIAAAGGVSAVISVSITRTSAQAPAANMILRPLHDSRNLLRATTRRE